jgi:Kdo2-lipid IVA lauroyltransferase/acyltransferase
MRLLSESFLLSIVKALASFLMLLPHAVSLWIASVFGHIGYFTLPKKRKVMYANLKTVYGNTKTPAELRSICRNVFVNFTKSVVELLCLPKIKAQGFDRFVTTQGWDIVRQSLEQGKGVILLAVHTGNWELASIVGCAQGEPYNIIANEQSKTPLFNQYLNNRRAIAGAKIIAPGTATRDIIRALKNNEIVTLVADQGGSDGSAVKFFGKTASMSTGAIRLALKYGIPICPVWINRTSQTHHVLRVFPPLQLPSGPDAEENMLMATQKAADLFSSLIKDYPSEYMWFYKVFKYTTEPSVLIVDDGRTGHLRQSQAAAQILISALTKKDHQPVERLVPVIYKSRIATKLCALYAALAQWLPFLCREDALKLFLTKESYLDLTSVKADYIISCGSTTGSINFLLSRCYMAKSICLLKPGLVSWNNFDLVFVPGHDDPPPLLKTKLVVTKAALNLITPAYLKEQGAKLEERYPDLKSSVRTKIGVLLGGDTKGVEYKEENIHSLIHQIKDAAQHFNADILLTTSRRTPTHIDTMIAAQLKSHPRCKLCIIANQENIPEAVGGIAALSDLLIVSGESISMVSEAVCAGKMTIVFSPDDDYNSNSPNKYDRFVLSLSEQGFVVAASIKDVSASIADMLRKKVSLKILDDRTVAQSAVEELVS